MDLCTVSYTHLDVYKRQVVETSSDTVPGVPCIDGISCDKVVLYEKLPIKQAMLKDILELSLLYRQLLIKHYLVTAYAVYTWHTRHRV